MKNTSDTNSPVFWRAGVPNLFQLCTQAGSRTSPSAPPELFPNLLHRSRIPVQCPSLCPRPYCMGSLPCAEELPTTSGHCRPPHQQGATQDGSVERSRWVAEHAVNQASPPSRGTACIQARGLCRQNWELPLLHATLKRTTSDVSTTV